MIPRSRSDLIANALLALACAALAGLAGDYAIPGPLPPQSWWPAGVALGALIGFGTAVWPGVLAGWLAGAWYAGASPAAALGFAAAGTAAALAGALAFRRLGLAPGLDRMRDVALTLGAVIPGVALLAALLGLAPALLSDGDGLAGPLAVQTAAALFSAMAFVPLLLGLAQGRPIATGAGRWLEFAAIVGLKTLTAVLISFSDLPYPVKLAFVVMSFPLLAWMAVRFNLLATGVLVAITLLYGMAGTVQGAGPLHQFAPGGQWTTLSVFGVLSAATALMLHAAVEAMRRVQRDLADSERRLRDIADSASDFFWETDAQGRLLYVSERFADFVGSQTEVLLGRFGFRDEIDTLTEADWPRLTESLKARAPYRNLRVPITTMTGARKVLQVSGKPMLDAAGRFLGYRGACSDVTDQIESADALFQAQKMETVGQLTGGLAHDFNNLLAVIIGNLELAEDALDDRERAGALLRKALGAAERGATLIQRLLAFARRQALSPRVVDVNALIAGLGDILEHSLGDRIALRRDLAADPWLVRVDPSQLEAAILNLALNARDAMETGGLLSIATRNAPVGADDWHGRDPLQPGDYVAVSISDTGSGMAPETLARAFEPFFTTKEAGRGSGLGLSMVYGFVRQSGGAVDARSAPGAGTTITLYLPRHVEAGAEAGAAAPGAPVGRGERILLVEDDAALRDLVARRLAALGYDAVAVEDARAALDRLGDGADIDLLLTDVVLPGGMYGDALAEEARRRRPDLPVLFMSGYPRSALDRLGRLDQAAQVLRKPFRNQELAARLRGLLDRSAAPAAIAPAAATPA
jgi:PAS domain S-box-containing protein